MQDSTQQAPTFFLGVEGIGDYYKASVERVLARLGDDGVQAHYLDFYVDWVAARISRL
jgi:hypothetical protein